jgi:superfamily II DNA or RNA helicase
MDARTTKLHAKSWLLHREGGLNTAFVGSSNLSHTALFDGLEWNVRLSETDAGHIIDRVQMTFESHWESEYFVDYDPAFNGEQFEKALDGNSRRASGEVIPISFAGLEVKARDYQERMLEALTVERTRHNRHRNLVVSATGTGKTVISALDYKQLCAQYGEDLSLLFVAHREQILEQSLATFRAVLHDGSFGEIHGGGRHASGRHVFGMIASLGEARLATIDPGDFDVVIVDEFHHARAPSYDRLLRHLEPRELLGLTATPERMDGKDVTEWFDNRIAVELRLWEAIDEGFLVPFQYFGIADGTDISDVTWRRGGYVASELSDVYTGDQARVTKLLRAIKEIVYRPEAMRALGFCVSIEHAKFMAQAFTDAGLASVAIDASTSQPDRATILAELRAGKIRCVFSVDVLGEGVDVPDVDTVLLLRPTASATVFTQQLGRGLRTADRKSHLTVIDMIGQHRREFRFDDRLRAIVDVRHGPIKDQVETGFPFLPSGCTIDLDRQSTELIVENLKHAASRTRWRVLVADLKRNPDVQLGEFLTHQALEPADLYRRGTWTRLRREAGLTEDAEESAMQSKFNSVAKSLLHIDDPERVVTYSEWLQDALPPELGSLNERDRRLFTMLAWGLGSGEFGFDSLQSFAAALWGEPEIRSELVDLFAELDIRSKTLAQPSVLSPEVPLTLHAQYTRNEIVAALAYGDGVAPPSTREGILWARGANADAFFVDLKKNEKDYSPTTLYRDFAINRSLFHWESQSSQHPGTPTVQRYINHESEGSSVLLFVRERKSNGFRTLPFTFLGPASYVRHSGERPVQFTWRLPKPMPEELFEVARSVAVA